MSIKDLRINPEFWKRTLVGYFAPVLAIGRLIKRRRFNYFRQLLVLSRYAFWKVPMIQSNHPQGAVKLKNPLFETLDDFLSRLPMEEQERHKAGAKRIAAELRRNSLLRDSFPKFVNSCLYNTGSDYIEINWMKSFQAKALMLYMPSSMPEHLTKVLEFILRLDKQLQRKGIVTVEALLSIFELHITHDLSEGKQWFEEKLDQAGVENE